MKSVITLYGLSQLGNVRAGFKIGGISRMVDRKKIVPILKYSAGAREPVLWAIANIMF